MGNQYASGSDMLSGAVLTLKSSAAQTASTNGPAVATGDSGNALVTVAVTAKAGTTPTLVVAIQGSNDGTNWVTLGSIGSDGYSVGNGTAPANFTAAGSTSAVYPALRYLRYSSTIGGSAGQSFTYSVTAAVA